MMSEDQYAGEDWTDEYGQCNVRDCDRTAITAVIGEAGDLYLCADHDGETNMALSVALTRTLDVYAAITDPVLSAAEARIREAARVLNAGLRLRWCEAHHDVVDYGRDDACRLALRINDEKACAVVKAALVRLPNGF